MEKFDSDIPEFIAKPATYVRIREEDFERLANNYDKALKRMSHVARINLVIGLIIGLFLALPVAIFLR